MIHIERLVFNPFQVNCYVLYDHKGACIIVDPSAYFEKEKNELTRYIENNNLTPALIINTHGHVDHIPGNRFLKEKYGIQVAMHKDDLVLLGNAVQQGLIFGFHIQKPDNPDIFLEDKQILPVFETPLEIRHTPGHSPGSVIIYSHIDNFVVTGDVLFDGSIGRTDFPGGSYNSLIKSILEEILSLPDETVVYPGHGESTTVGEERRNNPFLQGNM